MVSENKRTIKKSFWVNSDEDAVIKKNAKATSLSEAAYFRMLATGFIPVTNPDERFWPAMEEIREFSRKIDEIAMKADNSADAIAIMKEARKWAQFQNKIEMEAIRPKKRETMINCIE